MPNWLESNDQAIDLLILFTRNLIRVNEITLLKKLYNLLYNKFYNSIEKQKFLSNFITQEELKHSSLFSYKAARILIQALNELLLLDQNSITLPLVMDFLENSLKPKAAQLCELQEITACKILYSLFSSFLKTFQNIPLLKILEDTKNDTKVVTEIINKITIYLIEIKEFKSATEWLDRVKKLFEQFSLTENNLLDVQYPKGGEDEYDKWKEFWSNPYKTEQHHEVTDEIKLSGVNHEKEFRKAQDSFKARRKSHSLESSLSDYTKNIQVLLKKISTKIVKYLGQPPSNFTLLGFGSISREDMNLYSDLDVALLIDDESCKEHIYFSEFIRLLDFYLKRSCGSCMKKDGEPQWISLSLDTGDLSELLDGKPCDLVQTPKSLATWVSSQKSVANAKKPFRGLYRPVELYSSAPEKDLFARYLKTLGNQFSLGLNEDLNTKSQKKFTIETKTSENILNEDENYFSELVKLAFQDHQTDFARNKNELGLNYLKHCILNPLINWCLDIAFYWKILKKSLERPPSLENNINKLFKEFTKKSRLTADFVAILQVTWEKAQKLRIEWQMGEESIENSDKWLSLKDSCDSLLKILWGKQTTDKFLKDTMATYPFDPLIAYLELPFTKILNEYEKISINIDISEKDKIQKQNEFKKTIESTTDQLISCNAKLSHYNYFYQKISKAEYRLFFLEKIKQKVSPDIIFALSTLPLPDGWCAHVHEQEDAWYKNLNCLLVAEANSEFPVVHVEGMHIKGNLSLNVVKQILDQTGDFLENEEENKPARHKVRKVSIEGKCYHFKKCPEIPLFAISYSYLGNRIAIDGAPMMELVKFTVTIKGNSKNLIYPVLISQTIEGQCLDKVLANKEQRKNLLAHLDLGSFAQLVIVEALTNPADNFPRNFIVKDIKKHEKTLKQLVCIDPERIFVPDFSSTFLKGSKLEIRTVIYLFDQMMEVFDPITIKRLDILDPYEFIKKFLTHIASLDNFYYQLFFEHTKNLFNIDKNNPVITRFLLRAEAIKDFYKIFIKAKDLLKENEENITYYDWLRELRPKAMVDYQKLYQGGKDIKERLKNLQRIFGGKITGKTVVSHIYGNSPSIGLLMKSPSTDNKQKKNKEELNPAELKIVSQRNLI